MMKRILITSGKGGVGKTTVTANLGAVLSISGLRVGLIDGDARLRNLDAALGLQDRIIYDAKDIIAGHVPVTDGVIDHPLYAQLDLVAAPQSCGYDAGDVANLCERMEGLYDVVLIDSPAGIDEGFAACATAADLAIIVVTPDVAAIRDAIKTRDKLREIGIEDQHLVVNRVRPRMARRGGCMSAEEAAILMELDIIGTIKESRQMVKAANAGRLVTKGKLGAMLFDMASKL